MSSQVLYDSAVVKICLYKADVRSTCIYILFQLMLTQALGEWSSRSPRMAPCGHRHLQRACRLRSVAAPKWDCLGQILSETSPVEVAPFSLSGKNILQLIFRVNCSTCSVTLSYNVAPPKLPWVCLTVPAQLHNSARIHQEPQLNAKIGLNFNEAWPSFLQYASRNSYGLWLRRTGDHSWVLMQVFWVFILGPENKVQAKMLSASWKLRQQCFC